VLRGEKMVK